MSPIGPVVGARGHSAALRADKTRSKVGVHSSDSTSTERQQQQSTDDSLVRLADNITLINNRTLAMIRFKAVLLESKIRIS